jgi:chromosome segregation ATPase
MKITSVSAIALGAIAASLLLPAAAQQAKDPDRRVGTRDELRFCMSASPEIQARQKALKERGDKLGESAKELKAETDDLNAEQQRAETDDTYTGPRRERLERKVRAHSSKVKEARDLEAKFDADKAAFDKDLVAWREKCNNVQFMQDDLDAVKGEQPKK